MKLNEFRKLEPQVALVEGLGLISRMDNAKKIKRGWPHSLARCPRRERSSFFKWVEHEERFREIVKIVRRTGLVTQR